MYCQTSSVSVAIPRSIPRSSHLDLTFHSALLRVPSLLVGSWEDSLIVSERKSNTHQFINFAVGHVPPTRLHLSLIYVYIYILNTVYNVVRLHASAESCSITMFSQLTSYNHTIDFEVL